VAASMITNRIQESPAPEPAAAPMNVTSKIWAGEVEVDRPQHRTRGAGAAILLKFAWVDAPKWVAAALGIALGWVAVVFSRACASAGRFFRLNFRPTASKDALSPFKIAASPVQHPASDASPRFQRPG
jgi:hypothetical protein